ncbi:MAG TPA: hypothetical protein DCZ94_00155 [Lentisphaeria bacterium]|nr:MAG: hypothetical protein A2X48_15580 [Lentisphaerae bacterium GWF2_49_21]HBC85345.1 hypothetical protein [Lentisphaeria bacterium]
MNKYFAIAVVLLIALAFTSPSQAQAPAGKADPGKRGKIEYSADKIVDFNEGTYEVWFKPLFDMSAKPAGQEIQCFLLFVGGSGSDGLKVVCENVRTGGSIRISANFLKNPVALAQEKLKWNSNDWHYFAMTWKYVDDTAPDKRNLQMVFYADGKEYSKMDNFLKSDLPSTASFLIRIGDVNYNSKALVDAIRFSSKARTSEEIAGSFSVGPKIDKDTTLMDNFDKLQLADKTRAYTTPEGKAKGIITGSYERIQGKYGNAMKLSTDK